MSGGPYVFSKQSKARLVTCDVRIARVCREAIKLFDFSVVEGHRSVARQQQLYAQGRTAPGEIVTQLDGVLKKGRHNFIPSKAVDLVPWRDGKQQWEDKEAFIHLAGIMFGIAHMQGALLRWGGDWSMDDDWHDEKFLDRGHFEVVD